MATFCRHQNWMIFFAAVVVPASWAGYSHANAPAGRYTIANGTVHDTKTELTWQQTTSSNQYNWSDAQTYCANLNLDGTGWRVPSIKELQTIVDERSYNPSIDTTAFPPNTPSAAFWTSSPSTSSASHAWVVFFGGGNTGGSDVTATTWVRCVR